MSVKNIVIAIRVSPDDAYVDIATGTEPIGAAQPPHETALYASGRWRPMFDRWWDMRDKTSVILRAMRIISPDVATLYPHELRKIEVYRESVDVLTRLETAPTTVEAVAAAHRFAQLMKEFAHDRRKR